MRPVAFFIAVCALITAMAGHQAPATPTPDIVIPDPAECQVEPRTTAEYRTLAAATPTATDQAPALGERGAPSAESLPVGEPADTATIAEVEAIMTEYAACANADDQLRGLALFTEEYLVAIGPIDPGTVEGVLATTPEALPEDARIWIADIREVLLLDDGRVSAIVTVGGVEDDHLAPGRTSVFLFARVDGELRIDGQIERIVTSDGDIIDVVDAVATPAANP